MPTSAQIRDVVHTACLADEIKARAFSEHEFTRARLHNHAVRQWASSPDNLTVRDSERAILDLLAGVASWVNHRDNVDPFSMENIIDPLLRAAHDALNYDFGRLMGGPLSSFIGTLAETAEVTL